MVHALTTVMADEDPQMVGPLVARLRRLPLEERRAALATLPPDVRARVEAYLTRRTT